MTPTFPQPARHALSLIALLALSCTAWGQDSVTLGGVVDVAGRRVTNSAGSLTSVASGSNSTSRLFIRGNEDLGGGLTAGFWLEGQFSADTGVFGSGGQFFDRQSTVQLAGRFGEVRLGRDWNPTFSAWVFTDPFAAVGVAGAAAMFSQTASTAYGNAFGANPTTLSRLNNAIEYFTPNTLGGVYGHAMHAFGENSNASGNYGYDALRFGYAQGPLDVGAYAAVTRFDATATRFNQAGVRASYDFGAVRLSGSVNDSRFADAKHRAIILGAAVPLGPTGLLKASYVKVDQSGRTTTGTSIDANDADLIGLGYVYFLSKRTALYANAAHLRNRGAATYAIGGGAAPVAPGSQSTGYEVGLRHSF